MDGRGREWTRDRGWEGVWHEPGWQWGAKMEIKLRGKKGGVELRNKLENVLTNDLEVKLKNGDRSRWGTKVEERWWINKGMEVKDTGKKEVKHKTPTQKNKTMKRSENDKWIGLGKVYRSAVGRVQEPHLFVRVLVLGISVSGDQPFTIAAFKHDHPRRLHTRLPLRVEEQVLAGRQREEWETEYMKKKSKKVKKDREKLK